MSKVDSSYREILRIALPIFGGVLAGSTAGLIDTAFLGRLDSVSQSSAGYGYLIYLVIGLVGMGFATGMQILIARRNGENRTEDSGLIFWHGVYFILANALVIGLVLLSFTGAFLNGITRSDDIAEVTRQYVLCRIPGLPFNLINVLFVSFYVGIARTGIITVAAVSGALINVVLDYAMVFGELGFPAMGVSGAAYATVASEIMTTLVYVVYTITKTGPATYGLNRLPGLQSAVIVDMTRLSLPLMFQNFISIAAWFMFFTFIENMGSEELTVSINVRSVYSLFLMPIIALGSATNSMTSNLIGQDKRKEVYALAARILSISVGFSVVLIAILYPLFADCVRLFTDDEAVVRASLDLRNTIAAAIMCMSVAFVFFNMISGTGNTWVSLSIETAAIFVYCGFSYYVTLVEPGTLALVWGSEVLYFLLMGLMSLFYLVKFDRQLRQPVQEA
jgi:putative MATE family efflux protein